MARLCQEVASMGGAQSVRAAASSYQKVTGSIPGKPKCPWERQCARDEHCRRRRPSLQECECDRMNGMQCEALWVPLNHSSSTTWRKVHWPFPILPSLAGSKICTLATSRSAFPPDESAIACLTQQGAMQECFSGRGYAALQSAKLSSIYKYDISCFSTSWKLQESLGVL